MCRGELSSSGTRFLLYVIRLFSSSESPWFTDSCEPKQPNRNRFFSSVGIEAGKLSVSSSGWNCRATFWSVLASRASLEFCRGATSRVLAKFLVEDGVGLEKIWWKDSGKMGKIDSLNYFIPRVFPKLSHIHQPFYLEQHEGGLSRVWTHLLPAKISVLSFGEIDRSSPTFCQFRNFITFTEFQPHLIPRKKKPISWWRLDYLPETTGCQKNQRRPVVPLASAMGVLTSPPKGIRCHYSCWCCGQKQPAQHAVLDALVGCCPRCGWGVVTCCWEGAALGAGNCLGSCSG